MTLSLPAWMEILVNVIGYAGFIGIATWPQIIRRNHNRLPLRGHSQKAVTTPVARSVRGRMVLRQL